MKKKLVFLVTKLLWHKNLAQICAFVTALLIGITFFITAIAKLISPSLYMSFLDRTVAVFELVWIFFLIRFHLYWQMWLLNALIFFTWSGYSLFWLIHHLPCGCLGSWGIKSSALFFSLDIIFLIFSFVFAFIFKAKRKWIFIGLLMGIFCGILGFFTANNVWKQMIILFEER